MKFSDISLFLRPIPGGKTNGLVLNDKILVDTGP